jgi:hypothetical protein
VALERACQVPASKPPLIVIRITPALTYYVCYPLCAQVLGKMPNKTFTFNTSTPQLQPLALPEGTTPQAALERVLRLPSVCSKRFLTTKVDRHVTGEPADAGYVFFEFYCCFYRFHPG